jgi:hypothetical protein
MKIGFIVLCKTWWIRKNRNENLNLDDIIQLFSFYVISNISGLKKEKSLVSKAFITSKSITELYHELFSMEKHCGKKVLFFFHSQGSYALFSQIQEVKQ